MKADVRKGITFDEIKKIREACLSHAAELLAAADEIVGASPHIAYHLAALALEEIGKGQILLIEVTPGHRDEALRSFEKMREDHVKKLFWALWGATFTRERVSPEQMRDIQGLANTIHERRLAGLYVDWRGVARGGILGVTWTPAHEGGAPGGDEWAFAPPRFLAFRRVMP